MNAVAAESSPLSSLLLLLLLLFPLFSAGCVGSGVEITVVVWLVGGLVVVPLVGMVELSEISVRDMSEQ